MDLIIVLIIAVSIASIFLIPHVRQFILREEYPDRFWTAIASIVAVLTLIPFFLSRFLSEKQLRSSLRYLLAQELLENLRRAFFESAGLPFQTMGFHKIKENAHLVKDLNMLYELSSLYIQFDACIYYAKNSEVNREMQKIKAGKLVISYLHRYLPHDQKITNLDRQFINDSKLNNNEDSFRDLLNEMVGGLEDFPGIAKSLIKVFERLI